MPQALFFFLKIALAIWGLLWFHTNFRIVCTISVKNTIGILIGITLNLYIALGSMDILTKLIFTIHEHRISFHFLFLLQFLSLMSHSFQYTGLSPPWLNLFLGASLVAQWLRICLPMQGTRVRALVWEDPTCRRATRPVSHNY